MDWIATAADVYGSGKWLCADRASVRCGGKIRGGISERANGGVRVARAESSRGFYHARYFADVRRRGDHGRGRADDRRDARSRSGGRIVCGAGRGSVFRRGEETFGGRENRGGRTGRDIQYRLGD